MTQTHPLTPPEELLEGWYWTGKIGNWQNALTLAYRAGADQELEACVNWLDDTDCEDPQEVAQRLRATRRPKPPSLKEQALTELEEIMDELHDTTGSAFTADAIRRALETLPEPVAPTDEELDELFTEIDQSGEALSWRPFARAVLARWGTPAIQPVPVSERLPGPEDCDAGDGCWWWHPDHKEDDFDDGWILLNPKWAVGRRDSDDSLIYTHWLPANVLPTPEALDD